MTMTAKMPWLILLTLAWRVVARVSVDDATPQEDSPILVFSVDLNSQWTSCAPATFNWVYSGPDGVLSLSLNRVDGTNDTASSTRPLPTFTDNLNPNVRSLHRRDESFQIASSLSPVVGQLNLTALPVPPGRYKLVAIVMTSIFPQYSIDSSVFTVEQGSTTSCLLSSPLPSSTSSTSALSSTATSSGFASITSSDVSSTSPTVVPVGGVSNTPVNKGAIAGGIVAGIVVLLAVAVFYFLVIHRKRSRVHSRAPGGSHSHDHAKGGRFHTGASSGRKGGRWGGLSSVDSHTPPSESKVRPYGNTGRQPIGAGVSQDDINSDLSRSGSAHYSSYLGSPSEEKFSSSPSDEMILSAVPYRGPDLKLHIPNNNNLRSSASPPSPFEHRHSQTNAWRSSIDSSSPHGQAHAANLPAPSPASIAIPRKPARKPVPAYHETPAETPAVPTTSPAPSSPPAPPTTTPFADPVLPHPAPASSGHYSTRAERESLKSLSSKSKLKLRKDRSETSSTNASREDIEISAPRGLVHKNSFGPGGVEGKQLHYLIPDMPIGHR